MKVTAAIKMTAELKTTMIREIITKLQEQRKRIALLHNGEVKAKHLLGQYDETINRYQKMDPANFNAAQYPDLLTGLSEIDDVIREGEILIRLNWR